MKIKLYVCQMQPNLLTYQTGDEDLLTPNKQLNVQKYPQVFRLYKHKAVGRVSLWDSVYCSPHISCWWAGLTHALHF